ncbi:MAG: PAS domain-containing protein [Methyloceanibacter sp.]|jgi:two-component system cell cycle sensor histidine kinase/response regulator CckA|nr:PAS domain-containing protein [Methyloceanibacter sp.]
MTDIDAPMRYATPAADRTERDGSVGLVIVLALALAIAAVGLAMVSREMAEPFVLAILAGLAVVGVFCLFAGAVGILHFGGRHARNDVTKAFVDNLPQGALIGDSSGRVLYANEAYRDLLGLDLEASVPAPDRAFAGNPHLSEAIFRLSRAAQQGRSLKEEFRLPPPDEGEEETGIAPRWFRISVQPMPPDPRSGRKGALVVWQVDEITMDRAREEASFAKVQAAIAYLDSAPAGFFTADADGNIEYLNATLAQWLGLDLSEVAGRPLKLEEIMSADSGVLIARTGRGQMQGGTRRFDIDLVKADGTNLPVRILHRLPRPGTSGALAHALVLSRGPGEAEEAGAAELRFARLFHSAPIAIATVDAQGRISATNSAFMRLFGAAADEGRKLSLESLVEPESHPALRRALDAALARQSLIEPVDIAFAGDRDRSGRIYLSPIEQTGDNESAIAYAIETTEQRALEMQIAQGQKMQAVGQLAGGIAHDFNNMLTAIIGFSDFLLMNHRPTDPAFQDIMNIKQNANRAAGLVRQLLAFSRQQTLRPQVLQLGDVLSELSILLGRLLGENIELSLDQAGDLWPVKADLHQFEQVIINLAVNARDAMPDGGKLVIRTANIGEKESRALGRKEFPAGEYVLIEVSDTGSGMAPEVMQKIFEPFFSTKEIGRGTGLGLSTVYGIVKQTGGYVFPESEEGKGTVMRVYLPRYIETAAEVEQSKVEERRPEKPKDLTGRGTVLLVEDEDAVRSFAARALGQRGYNVLQATTGVEALEVFNNHQGEVDLVVSDVVMPEMDGPTLFEKLRRQRPDLKVIFISGYAEDAFRQHLAENEDFMFLQKPFDLKELAAAVKAALEG